MSLSYFGIDAGGTSTKVSCRTPEGRYHLFTHPSINPCSNPAADQALADTLDSVREYLRGTPAHGWIASSSICPQRPQEELSRLQGALDASYPEATAVASNDVLPMLRACITPWQGIVTVSGTGSAFLGRSSDGAIVTAGGCEYLASDEGGGADIGKDGLRAAVRAADGRGPKTAITGELARRFAGRTPQEIGRRLAGEAYPKQRLAALAPAVTTAWAAGDEVAHEVMSAALTELVRGIETVAAQLDPRSASDVVLVGGVATGSPRIAEHLQSVLRQNTPEVTVRPVPSPEVTVLRAARTGPPEDLVNSQVWNLTSKRSG